MTETITEPQIVTAWSRLPRETDAAWAYFLAYRDQAYPDGVEGEFRPRNVAGLSREMGVSRTYLATLSMDFKWPQRAGAYDREVDKNLSEAVLSEAQRLRKAHVRRLAKLGTMAEGELDKLVAKAQDPSIPVLSPKDVLAFLDHVFKAERLVSGEVTDRMALQSDWDLEKLSLEELELLDKMRRKAGGTG